MFDPGVNSVMEAAVMLENIRTKTSYRPSRKEFETTFKKIASAKERLRLLQRTMYNSLGTVIHSMVSHGYEDLVECALGMILPEDHLALLMLTSDTGRTAFHIGAKGGKYIIMRILLTAEKDQEKLLSLLKKTDVSGCTALHYAAENNFPSITRLILSNIALEGADDLLLMKNIDNMNAYDLAVQNEATEVLHVLEEFKKKKDISGSSKKRKSALGSGEFESEAIARLKEEHEREKVLLKSQLVEQFQRELNDMREEWRAERRVEMKEEVRALWQTETHRTTQKDIQDDNSARLDNCESRLENHDERIGELETPLSQPNQDGGESWDELAELSDAKYPVQESLPRPR